MIDFEVYRNEYRTIAWGTEEGQSAQPGHVVVDPPSYIVDRNGDQLVRIDEDGYVPRYDLLNMRLSDARRIAERADTDEVDGNSQREEIIDALAPEPENQEAEQERDDEDADAWEILEEASGQSSEEMAAESVESSESSEE